MRAHEFIAEDQKRRPEISLRHLNHLKHVGRSITRRRRARPASAFFFSLDLAAVI